MTRAPIPTLSAAAARRLWLGAQRLDEAQPFGAGPEATAKAIAHLGYVQIDTINVIERCHHHILWNRIPSYSRDDLHRAQTRDKSVFEYWTHALSYVPTCDLPFFLPDMRRRRAEPGAWFRNVADADLKKVMTLIRDGGALSIRDIEDDELVEKDHAWASRKPSKRALQLAFFSGRLAVSERRGMLKTYELMERHFDWATPPKPASARAIIDYRLDRALRAQGVVSLDSICHLDAPAKAATLKAIETRVRKRLLTPVAIKGLERVGHWAATQAVEAPPGPLEPRAHILSPFDPLIIQRKRLSAFFAYDHLFEAYVPKDKRRHGYFALPVLLGDAIVAAIDLKTDRAARKLRVQQWNWVGSGSARAHKRRIEEELHRFEAFQLAE